MSIWAEIKKAINSDLSKPLNTLIGESAASINSDLSKPLDTLITESKSDLSNLINNNSKAFPNVSFGNIADTVVHSVTGRGRITFVARSNANSVKHLTITELDGASNFSIPVAYGYGMIIFAIEFEESVSFRRTSAEVSVDYIVQLK